MWDDPQEMPGLGGDFVAGFVLGAYCVAVLVICGALLFMGLAW